MEPSHQTQSLKPGSHQYPVAVEASFELAVEDEWVVMQQVWSYFGHGSCGYATDLIFTLATAAKFPRGAVGRFARDDPDAALPWGVAAALSCWAIVTPIFSRPNWKELAKVPIALVKHLHHPERDHLLGTERNKWVWGRKHFRTFETSYLLRWWWV